MRREEYLHTLTEQIRCKMARGTIEQEINDHIEDQKAEFLSEGMSQTEAEEAAVREMGDPVEVGLEMDRIHRPTISRPILLERQSQAEVRDVVRSDTVRLQSVHYFRFFLLWRSSRMQSVQFPRHLNPMDLLPWHLPVRPVCH